MQHYLWMLCSLLSFGLWAQSPSFSTSLKGHWEGAFIKNNSYQKIDIEFYQKNGQWFSLQVMEEWHPTYGELEVPVKVDSTGLIKVGTGYGAAELVLDSNNLELLGQVKGQQPTLYVHLKKAPPPPTPSYTVEPVSINSKEAVLKGHLHLPKQASSTAIILVGGRGCFADETAYNLYAKFLRAYGVTVLAYQKRGTGKSTGDCSTATISDLAEDLQQVHQFLKKHPRKFAKIGVLGISAGGWTMVKAEEQVDFDFMISVVGPATSVKDQQLQSAAYGAAVYDLSAAAKANVLAYTKGLFEIQPKDFATLEVLLAKGEEEGWKDLLEDTDVATNAAALPQLWVRRHQYDPKTTLTAYNKPFLGIYGQKDWIVPFQENIAALEACFADNPQQLTTVIARQADHGMETTAAYVNLSPQISYWHFYRSSPQVRIAIVDFLQKHKLIGGL